MNSSGVACSSNTPPPNERKYDVFISFRGSDTRAHFTSLLYDALTRENISTFIVGELKRGDPISTLFPTIENSKVSVVIFSQNYASSTWCLEELVKMVECKETSGQTVIPVFYEVSPSDVKNQTNSYAESFGEHHQKQKPETILKWINALREAYHLAGWHISGTRPDLFLIEEIVKDIRKKLKQVCPVDNKSSNGSDSKPGEVVQQQSMYDPLKRSKPWHPGYRYQDLRRNKWLGALRYLHLDEFDLKSLHPDHNPSNFPEAIAKFLCEKLTTTQNVISTPETINRFGTTIITSLAALSVDEISKDVSFCNKGLVGIDSKIESSLCIGSKIYKLHELSDDEALQLFTQYAFKQEEPHAEYKDLSQMIVKYAKGVPLAIILLGAALHGNNKHVWERAMRNPDRIFSKDIKAIVESGYDGQGGDMKFGLLRGERIGHGLEESSNLQKLVKSDIDQGCSLESLQSDAQSNLQENPLVEHDMLDRSIEKLRKDDQRQTIPELVECSKPLSHLETTGKEATKQTGLLKWLGSKLSLSSEFDSSATEELRHTIKSQQQIIEQQQLQLTSTEEQLAQALQRIEEQATMILDISSRCQRMEDFLGHVRSGPPPSPPSIGRGSAMTC